MPTLDLGDFSKIGVLPPVGHYRCQVTKNPKLEINKRKDGKSFVLKCIIIDSPDENFENFAFKTWLSIKSSALFKVKEAFEAITQTEWEGEETPVEIDDDETLIDPELEDKTFIAEIGHSADGQFVQVNKYYPDDGSVEIGLAGESDEE